MQAISCLIYKFFALVIYLDFDTSMSANDFYKKLATVGADLSLIAFASDHFEKYFTGRNFRGEKLSRGKKNAKFLGFTLVNGSPEFFSRETNFCVYRKSCNSRRSNLKLT